MSNEQILEELLFEAHGLGLCPEIFQVVTKYSDLKQLDAYQKAFNELKTIKQKDDIKNKIYNGY